jgi:hypothetical protein
MKPARKAICVFSLACLLIAAGCILQKGELPVFLQNSDPGMKPTKKPAVSTTPAVSTPFNVDDILPTARPGEIRQWAVKAAASSEFMDTKWSAMQASGKPNALTCEDNINAWAAADQNTIEWIDLDFDVPVIPTEINIFQNYNPSQVTEVAVITDNGEKLVIWEGYPEKVKDCPDLMTVTVDQFINKPVRRVRVTLDQRVNGWGWNEIDAVELVGTKP